MDTILPRSWLSALAAQGHHVGAGDADAAVDPGPLLGCRRRIDRSVTLLPEPDSPSSATISPRASVEVDAGHRAHRLGAAGERHVAGSRCSRIGIAGDRSCGPRCGLAVAATRRSTMWQAAAWPARVDVASAGSAAEQTPSAKAQRVWKRQPDGGLIGLGGSPASGASAVRRSGSMDSMRAEQRRGVGMAAAGVERLGRSDLGDLAEVHDEHAGRRRSARPPGRG